LENGIFNQFKRAKLVSIHILQESTKAKWVNILDERIITLNMLLFGVIILFILKFLFSFPHPFRTSFQKTNSVLVLKSFPDRNAMLRGAHKYFLSYCSTSVVKSQLCKARLPGF
jgi:hypothetical protein